MTDAQIRMECSSCGKRVPFMTMSYGKNKDELLCKHCFERQNPKKQPMDNSGKEKFVCNSCKYKFLAKKGKKALLCPYCGKKDISPASVLSADNLLKESILE